MWKLIRDIDFSAIVFGQGLSILNTFTGVFSKLLLNLGLDTPLFQLLWTYFLIYTTFQIFFLISKQKYPWRHGWKYAIASITDSQANFLTVLAYQKTSVVSVLTLVNTSLIFVMILSYFFLKHRYNKYQYLGAAIALCGVCVIVISDLKDNNWDWGGTVEGDLFVLIGSILYAVTNVYVEYLMKNEHGPQEYLVVLGGCGSVIMLIESMCLEMDKIRSIDGVYQGKLYLVLCYVGFSFTMLMIYSCTPYYFEKYGAAMFNLSLLTAMVYGLLFGIMIFGESMSWLYLIGYFFVMTGIFVYNLPKKNANNEENYTILTALSCEIEDKADLPKLTKFDN